MCGICGFVGPEVSEEDLYHGLGMRESLHHRGPEGCGEAVVRGEANGRPLLGWIGHRRLKIIDLTEHADQPMRSSDERVVLTYNGEVYNFRELRSELAARGHRFHSSGDTEVVLRAYEEWGEGFVERIDGMFALAIWDGRRGSLLLARDRTGKKPLFYSTAGGRLTFGSEIKSLLAAPWVSTDVDRRRIPEFFTYGYVPWPNTMYADIRQVPPAGVVVYHGEGGGQARRYWDALPIEPAADGRPGETELAGIRRVTTDAVRRRMIADVPLGALLSGGMDSSIVVGLMSQESVEPVHTFSIGFPDQQSFDERGYARKVAEHFGTRHSEFAVKADAVGLLDRLLWHHDQPFADSSAIPTYLLCELARNDVTVVLNGDGGDEVFGGYGRFAAVTVTERVPDVVQIAARRAVGLLPVSHSYASPRRRLERLTQSAGRSPHDRYQSWISILDEDLLAEAVGAEAPTAAMADCYRSASNLPVLDQILYANFNTYLPDDLAVKMDRMSMAHSLETRSPFLDTAVIELMATIPAARKVGLRRVKPLLRRAFWPLLPAEIWNRPKHGFDAPLGHWFRSGELGTLFEDEVLDSTAQSREYISPDAVRSLWQEHRDGERERSSALWTILTFERWLRTAGKQGAEPPPVPMTA